MQPKSSRGAFLVIALILLIVLSAIAVATMNLTMSSFRVARNYSNYMQAEGKAISMAGYGMRILDTYTNYKFPLPATCNSSSTCNLIQSAFPYSGRPTLAWSENLNTDYLVNNAGSNSWWTTNGFAYEATFAGSGNARVIVSLLGAQTSIPWTHTYEIAGYATDNIGQVRKTSQIFTSINGYRPDPYPSSASGNAYSLSACAGGCPYGQCCSGTTCSSSQAVCENATETYVPPGWSCSQYFVTNLGYSSTTCNNKVATALTGMSILENVLNNAYETFLETGSFPSSVVVNNITVPAANWTAINYEGATMFAYERTGNSMMAHVQLPNVFNRYLTYAIKDNGNGTASYVCGGYSISSYPNDPVQKAYLPPTCNCYEVASWFYYGTACTGV